MSPRGYPNKVRGTRNFTNVSGDKSSEDGFYRLIKSYLFYLEVRGYARSTLESRSRYIALFVEWVIEKGINTPQEVTQLVIESYQRHLFLREKSDGNPLSFSTQNQNLVGLKSFFSWCAKEHYISYNPASELELPRVEHRLPKDVLTKDEAELVLNVPDVSTHIGLRQRAILEVLYCCAIRRQEVINLTLADIDWNRKVLAIRQGKGKRDRFVPISDRALNWLKLYLDKVRQTFEKSYSNNFVFLSKDGYKIGADYLSQSIRATVKDSKVDKKGSCHLFRHTAATLMVENGADIRIVAELLGHQHLETTQIYTRVSISHLSRIHKATHPSAQIENENETDK